jgi:thiosulfate/3-mercaptopyruvate sulfurtransferase
MARYENSPVLIETDHLAEKLGDPSVRVIEVDEDTTAYEKGHIENALGWNWFVDLKDPLRRDFVDQAGLSRLLQEAGVDDDTTVVLYGGNNNWFAAYAYWLLRYLGFDNVKLLNGGRKKWELEGRPFVTEVPSFPKTDFRIEGPVRTELRVYRDDVLARLGKVNFVDVRSPEEYRGDKLAPDHLPQEQAQVPGHIPGAVNIPWSKAADEDGTFKSPDALAKLYEEQGITKDHETIAYCRIGERSAHTWFVLHELLGYPAVQNYDGSWTEYGSLVGVPIER